MKQIQKIMHNADLKIRDLLFDRHHFEGRIEFMERNSLFSMWLTVFKNINSSSYKLNESIRLHTDSFI
jgi:hypothetical protein